MRLFAGRLGVVATAPSATASMVVVVVWVVMARRPDGERALWPDFCHELAIEYKGVKYRGRTMPYGNSPQYHVSGIWAARMTLQSFWLSSFSKLPSKLFFGVQRFTTPK